MQKGIVSFAQHFETTLERVRTGKVTEWEERRGERDQLA